jgi:hypothetical protein
MLDFLNGGKKIALLFVKKKDLKPGAHLDTPISGLTCRKSKRFILQD